MLIVASRASVILTHVGHFRELGTRPAAKLVLETLHRKNHLSDVTPTGAAEFKCASGGKNNNLDIYQEGKKVKSRVTVTSKRVSDL